MLDEKKIDLHLELDLEPASLRAFFDKINNARVKCVFDIGNSASLGFEPNEELDAIGGRLGSVHVKDRVLGAGTVLLGTGDANFPAIFRKLKELEFKGWYTLQAARDPSQSEESLARQNRSFVKNGIA